MSIGAFLKKNALFLIPACLLLGVGIVFLLLYPKDVIHITQNGWYHTILDPVFKYGTNLGDGLVFVASIVGLLFISYRKATGMLYAALFTLVFIGLFKQVIFKGEPRPHKYFIEKYELRLVEGVRNHNSNSFPSGHTTTAFAICGLLAFYFKKRWVKVIALVLAILAGYSRIYLSQHFLVDVVAGGFLGIFIAMLSYYLSYLNKKQWANKGLLKNKG